jgi:hypothetical protein
VQGDFDFFPDVIRGPQRCLECKQQEASEKPGFFAFRGGNHCFTLGIKSGELEAERPARQAAGVSTSTKKTKIRIEIHFLQMRVEESTASIRNRPGHLLQAAGAASFMRLVSAILINPAT